MSKTLYLLRHGDTGAGGRFVGSSDVPLAVSAYGQLDRVKEEMCQKPVTRILCSPQRRCLQTVEHLGLASEIIICPELREIDFGAWENKTFSEIVSQYPAEVDAWSTWSADFCFPEGEKTTDFLARVGEVKNIINSLEDEQVLVITHGGVIRQLICAYLGLPSVNYLLFDIKAGYYSTLSLFSKGGILTSLNSG